LGAEGGLPLGVDQGTLARWEQGKDILRGSIRFAMATLRKCKRQRAVNLDAAIQRLAQVHAESKMVATPSEKKSQNGSCESGERLASLVIEILRTSEDFFLKILRNPSSGGEA
jgi:hypothetical protein